MQIGAENRNKVIALVVLAAVAMFFVPSMFTSKPAPASAAHAGAALTTTRKPATRTGGKRLLQPKGALVASLDPTLRFDLLKSSEDQEYTGGRRNIFEPRQIEIPKPIDNGSKKEAQGPPPPPPGPPPPPPINLKFYGFATQTGKAKRVFLSTGEDVFVGGEGEVVDRRYRIVKINTDSVLIEDILNNNQQKIPLTQG